MSFFHQMAEEISRPLCEAKKVTMVSSGGGDVGVAKLSGEVLDIMTQLPEALEKLTGVNISQVTHSGTRFMLHLPTFMHLQLIAATDQIQLLIIKFTIKYNKTLKHPHFSFSPFCRWPLIQAEENQPKR